VVKSPAVVQRPSEALIPTENGCTKNAAPVVAGA